MIKAGAEYKLEKSEVQKLATNVISNCEITLLEGGSRSGKTFLALYIILVRCLHAPGSVHLVSRFRFSHVKQSICYGTMPKLLKATGQTGICKLNKSDWFYEFPNKSQIWIGGLDDKERTEKILGNEYDTIFLNEGSQISYEAYEMIVTRLNPGKDLNGKIIIDYNPPSIHHWGYKIFHKREFPDGRPVPENDYKWIKMNPVDNPFLSSNYLKRLENLSEGKRRRFLAGEYSADTGSLFRRSWIKYRKEIPEDILRIVVGVDPSGSVNGDEIGIIVCAQLSADDYVVLEDASLHGTPKQWSEEVVAVYHKWNADLIIAEKNFGGDMVESTIKNADASVNVKLVTSSRGKIVRAEPISALYEQGKIKHRTLFTELEDEMCMYEPGNSQSPNRMDALVFAVTELTGSSISMLDVI